MDCYKSLPERDQWLCRWPGLGGSGWSLCPTASQCWQGHVGAVVHARASGVIAVRTRAGALPALAVADQQLGGAAIPEDGPYCLLTGRSPYACRYDVHKLFLASRRAAGSSICPHAVRLPEGMARRLSVPCQALGRLRWLLSAGVCAGTEGCAGLGLFTKTEALGLQQVFPGRGRRKASLSGHTWGAGGFSQRAVAFPAFSHFGCFGKLGSAPPET